MTNLPRTGELEMRIHGSPGLPVLIYLPGLHGDWTLLGGFRKLVAEQVRLVEFTYPRRTDWTVDDYADAILAKLAEAQIGEGILLAESFGSQVAWGVTHHGRSFQVQGIILAGGFVRHPVQPGVLVAQWLNRHSPLRLIKHLLRTYICGVKRGCKPTPNGAPWLEEFFARRMEPGDREAIVHRYTLIRQHDWRPVARAVKFPVYYLTGYWDPIVPWQLVRPWLRRNCPGFRECHIIRQGEHGVLSSAPHDSARQITTWVRAIRAGHQR
jgi:pimeloyl-ACP methyl ester carboxylesterase